MLSTRVISINKLIGPNVNKFAHQTIRFLQKTVPQQNVINAKPITYEIKQIDSDFRYKREPYFSIYQFDSSPSINSISTFTGIELDTTWLNKPECTNQELIERLLFVSNYCLEHEYEITSTTFDTFVDNFVGKLHEFNENELIAALQIFSRMPKRGYSFRDRNFIELWMALDDNCGFAIQNWDIDQLLNVCDIWMSIIMTRRSKFVQITCRRFIKKAQMMTIKQYVRAMQFSGNLDLFIEEKTPFMKHLDNILDKISLEETGIVCGVVDLKESGRLTKVDMIHRLIAKVIHEEHLDKVDDKSLYNVLRVIEASIRLEHKSLVKELLKKLSQQVTHRPNKVNFVICNLGSRVHKYNEECITALLERAVKNIDEFTIVDMEQTAFVVCKFFPPSQYELVKTVLTQFLHELPKRTAEIALSPRRLVTLMYCLAIFGIHSEDLIQNVLRSDFIKAVYPYQNAYPPELFGLDAYTKINLRDSYKGDHLDEKSKKCLINTVMAFIPKRNGQFRIRGTDEILVQIEDVVKEQYTHYCLGHALPHSEYADLYLIFDKNKNAIIDYRNEFPEPYSGNILSKDDITKSNKDLEVIVIVASYWKNYNLDSNIPNAFHQHKLDQLALLDYKVVNVSFFEWVTQNNQRKAFIKDKIDYALSTILSERK